MTTSQIDLANGKYTFILDENDVIKQVLRHGEPWPAGQEMFRFNNCAHAMLWEIMDHRARDANKDASRGGAE